MSSRKSQSDAERERARRILEQQLKARDPGVSKIKGYDWDKHAKRSKQIQKSRQKPLLVDLYDVLPRRWKGALWGGIVGLLPLIAGLIFLTGHWQVLGLLGLMICGVVGFVIGKVTQDEIRR
jgi:hypothetical protein